MLAYLQVTAEKLLSSKLSIKFKVPKSFQSHIIVATMPKLALDDGNYADPSDVLESDEELQKMISAASSQYTQQSSSLLQSRTIHNQTSYTEYINDLCDSGRFAAFKDISSYIFVYQAVPDVIQSLLNKGVSPASVKGLIDATLAKWDSNKIESKKTAVAIDIADMLDMFPALKLAMAPMGMELDQNTQLAVYATGCRPMARENQGAGKSTMCTTAAWLESEESEYNPNQPFRTEGLFPTDVAVHIILHQAGAAAAAAGVTEGMMQRNACRGKFPSSLAVVYMLFN